MIKSSLFAQDTNNSFVNIAELIKRAPSTYSDRERFIIEMYKHTLREWNESDLTKSEQCDILIQLMQDLFEYSPSQATPINGINILTYPQITL